MSSLLKLAVAALALATAPAAFAQDEMLGERWERERSKREGRGEREKGKIEGAHRPPSQLLFPLAFRP